MQGVGHPSSAPLGFDIGLWPESELRWGAELGDNLC